MRYQIKMDSLDQTIFRFTEELRFRRKICGDLDEKIKHLRSEILKCEKLLEEKDQKFEQSEAEYARQTLEIKKISQEKIFESESKQQLLKSTLEMTEGEFVKAKEEVYKLKLEKYENERKFDDLQRKLQTISSNGDAQTTVIATCQQRLQRLQSTVKELFEQVRRLTSSVEQSKKFHDDLEKLCCHKDCELRSALEAEKSARNALISVEAELKLTKISKESNENKCTKCTDFRFKMEKGNQTIDSLNEDLVSSRNEITNLLELLSTNQQIVQKEIALKESAENELIKYKREANELKKRCELLTKEIDDLKKSFNSEIEPGDENSMKILISNLKSQLEIEKYDKLRLEQILVDSATKEMEYQNKIFQLQAEVNLRTN